MKEYGYGKAREYVLVHKGKRYDSKAIYGVAQGLRATEFSGGEATVRRWLTDLGFKVESLPVAAQATALVLTAQEETSGGEYDFWADREGVQYHFPNKYRNLVKSGLPFVYYRGVRRMGGKRGEPEYYGVGRVGDVWLDEEHPADRAQDRRWFCAIEDYREFEVPVPWKRGGSALEKIRLNQFRDGVRSLPIETFERICALADVTLATPLTEPDLPPVEEVVLKRLSDGSLLAPPSKRTGSDGGSGGGAPARRSRNAQRYGDHAELLAKRELERLGKKGIRHLAAERLTPGYDLQYNEGSRVIAVEVKGTTGRQFANFDLTEKELQAVIALGKDYQIWLVADIRSATPTLEIVNNPAQLLASGEWTKSPLLWQIKRGA